ncbi:general transcription factor 3C polypeptide 1 [Harpegnathos saltator]|uniref:general transcription factor 3C polypeptide 1 n=1 Tax=Harpegnathos saltator TaxID=610380 RepID=UPI00058F019A|nr:general transcription factor 3C polypeptide 1 [Harpegnathos saltator]
MALYPSFNLVESIVDEVALEGLDGITLQALWIRLANRFHDPLPLPKPFMNQVWTICKRLKEFSFYELNTPREPLVIFDRYEYVHPDLGIILEPPNVPSDIYPHYPIKDSKTGVRGSCSTYHSRKNISDSVKKASLDEVTEKYGLSLVIVASQSVRTRALMDSNVSPTLELTIMHYCFLERVGRSRYHGEVTQGKLSLSALNEDPKSLFYHRKFLLQHKLITKQVHHQKSSGHYGNGSLLHLPRFYVERKPKVTYLAEQVLEILRSKKNGVAEYDEIKKKLGIENSIKKLFKTSFFQKIVKTDICVPYRTLYPNAEPSEWRQKQDPTKEKKIRVVQVLYPDVDIADLWNKEEKDDDEDAIELDVSNHKYKVPYLKQANAIVEASKLEGISQVQLGRQMGLTKLQSRAFLRNLVKIGIIATYMNDMGRQRITKYVSKKYEKRSTMSKQFNKEMYKIKELTKRITSETEVNQKVKVNVHQESEKIQVKQENNQNIHSDNRDNSSNVDASVDDTDTHENCVEDSAGLRNKFHVANSILRRYRLLKSRSRYKCTSSKSFILKVTSKAATKEEKSSPPISMQQIANNAKVTSLYNNIKTNLIMQRPVRSGNGVNEVFGFMEAVQNSNRKNTSNITYRLLRRANMIIEAVKEHQVIDDMTKLMKMIYEEEDKEGYDVKIDKKSLIRLLQKLAKDNLVKNIKLTLSANNREKNLTFICDPNIDTDHTVIKSAVEQAKLKFCLMGSQKPKVSAKKAGSSDKQDKTDKSDSKDRSQELGKTTVNYEYDPTAGKRYGLSPKFIKMQTIHVLLFYLVYAYNDVPKVSQEKQIEILRTNGYEIDDNLAKEFSTIYNTKVSWEMFIPPLPKHGGWPEGWALMCDVLMGLPLSIFVKVFNIKYVIPELERYLSHPIRKHYLVKNLPADIRDALLYARKYIYNIHSIVSKLGYIGLVQFGPQRLKDKDQVFIYVNRRTELMDTMSSAPSYHNIEDKKYPVTKYFFDSMKSVEKYWYDMWNICINTPLGGRLVVHGKDILVEDLDKKSILVEAIVARNPKKAASMDTGVVPGDRKGAAGIDSAFFAHLKRNWNWATNYSMNQTKTSRDFEASRKYGKSGTGQRDLHLSKIQMKPVKYTEYVGLKKVSGPPAPEINGVELQKQKFDQAAKLTDTSRKNEALPSHQTSKQKSFVRRVMPRKKSSRPRLKYDEDDYRAMQKMHKLRADWAPYEVNILLVCKVAMTYLSPNPRKQVVNFIAVRDVLRTYSYTSNNKTSRACQRRLMYMLRQKCTINSIALGVEEIKQDPVIDQRYNGIMDRLKKEYKNSGEYEKRVTEVFKELVALIMKKFYIIADMKPNKHTAMPKTVQEFNFLFKTIYPAKPYQNQGFRKDVRNANDINSATINSLIHSSIYCARSKRSWAYELYKVYQYYSEPVLRQAMVKIRSDQMVTMKKNHLSAMKKGGNYLPMCSSLYKLSANYEYKFQTKWPQDVFKGAFDTFTKLLQYYSEQRNVALAQQENIFNGIEIQPVSSGIVMAIHDLLVRNQIDFDIEMPEQVIMLDSRYQDKNETYFRVAQRYQDIMTRLYRFKFENVDAQNARSLELDEIEMNENVENPATRKRPVDKSDNFGEPAAKISRTNEEGDKSKRINKSSKNQPNEVITEKKSSVTTNRSVKLQETTSKDHSSVQVSTEKNRVECTSKKRPIDAEEDSVDCEKPLKRLRLNSDDSMDLPDVEELEESNLYEDLKNIEKMKIISKSSQVKELPEKQTKSASSSQPSSSTDLTAIPRRVSEIIKNMPLEINYLRSYWKIEETNDIQKKYTRLTILGMKEELDDLSVADSHHAHEYFVVNAFKMFYSLELPSSVATSVPNDQETCKSQLASELVSLKIEKINKVLDEISHFAIFPGTINDRLFLVRSLHETSYKDHKDYMITKKGTTINWRHVDAICNFVREKKELGVCPQDLIDKFFSDQGTDLYTIVSHLVENRIFLRSGVTCPRYIHHHYVDSWLIHSCKIYRLEQEAMGPFKDSVYATMPLGKTAITNVETDAKHENTNKKLKMASATPSTSSMDYQSNGQEVGEKVKEDEKKADDDLNDQKNLETEDNETNKECDTSARKRPQRQRTCSSSQKDKPVQQPDLTTEEIKVVIRPWIRIDGVLNRKVLDQMLGSVLGYSLLHPGLTLTKIQNRFIPALQPFHTRELVEILIKLGCLESKLLKKPRVTLFSQPSTLKISNLTADASCWAADDEIVLEPAVDSVLKFGIFLNRTISNTDFM